nr:unnamed protein product [Spirometra erinaceieuropaei]
MLITRELVLYEAIIGDNIVRRHPYLLQGINGRLRFLTSSSAKNQIRHHRQCLYPLPPTKTRSNETNKFDEELHAFSVTASKTDKLIVHGDFSAGVEIDHAAWEGVSGFHRNGACNNDGLFPQTQPSGNQHLFPPSDMGEGNGNALLLSMLTATELYSHPEVGLLRRAGDKDDLRCRRLDGSPPHHLQNEVTNSNPRTSIIQNKLNRRLGFSDLLTRRLKEMQAPENNAIVETQ